MPNHVTNRLTITGPAESIADFRAACFAVCKPGVPSYWRDEAAKPDADPKWAERIAKREAEPEYEVFDFNKIVPTPAYITQGDLRHGSREQATGRNWYDWNYANWGTKWNAYELTISEDTPERLVFKFDTAWASPDPIFNALGKAFPELAITAEYFDEGHCFWGSSIKPAGVRDFIEEVFSDHKASDRALAERNRLCLELKGYDPEADEEEPHAPTP